jgi:hypothetical protein
VAVPGPLFFFQDHLAVSLKPIVLDVAHERQLLIQARGEDVAASVSALH